MHAKFIISRKFMRFFSNTKIGSNLSSKKGGFTLVEMLIVIVIIGILAAALIPRLNTARGRANDTARKADLQQVSAVMVSYSIDHGVFPGASQIPYSLYDLASELKSAGISSIPLDPNRTRVFDGLTDAGDTACPGTPVTINGQYGYIPIKKNGISYGGFILMAGAETLGGANTILDEGHTEANSYGNGCINADANYDDILLCDDIVFDDNTTNITPANGDPCTTVKDSDLLRYIYIY